LEPTSQYMFAHLARKMMPWFEVCSRIEGRVGEKREEGEGCTNAL